MVKIEDLPLGLVDHKVIAPLRSPSELLFEAPMNQMPVPNIRVNTKNGSLLWRVENHTNLFD
jgi:hypothetical protein